MVWTSLVIFIEEIYCRHLKKYEFVPYSGMKDGKT
jgi:hypothetical protein